MNGHTRSAGIPGSSGNRPGLSPGRMGLPGLIAVLCLWGGIVPSPAFPESVPGIPSPATDLPPSSLSVDQAVMFGLTHHPKLFWFQHGVKKQAARVGASRSHFFPHVGAGMIYAEANPGVADQAFNNSNFFAPIFPMTYAKGGPLDAPGEPVGMATLGANQMLFDFGKFEHRVRERLAGQKASEFRLYSQDAWVILQVKEAYYHVLLDRTLVTVYQKNLDQRTLVRDLTRALYRSDYKSRLDYDFAQVDLEKARALLKTEQNDLDVQIAHLNDAMGLGQAGRPDYRLTDRLDGEKPQVSTDLAIARGLTYRPEINATRNLYKGARERALYDRAQHFPLISAFGSYGYLGNMATSQTYSPGWWSGGGSLTIPLYTGGLIRSLTQRDRELARERKFRVSDWSHNIRYQVVRAHKRVDSDTADIKAYSEAVKEADLALTLATKRYSANLVSIVGLTMAELYLLNTQAELALDRYNYQVDYATLRFAEGVDYLSYLPGVRKNVAGKARAGE